MPSATSTEQASPPRDPSRSITAAILAGGAATRLAGRDKGLESLDGRPLIEWVLEAIGGQVSSCLIIANRNLETYSVLARTVPDNVPGFMGPLAGIATALGSSATDWVMTVPVDCPQPPRDLAQRLMRCAASESAQAVVAHDGERRQPLFALYRRELAASAVRHALKGEGVWKWQTAIGAHELDFSDRRLQFHNLNSPADFAARDGNASAA